MAKGKKKERMKKQHVDPFSSLLINPFALYNIYFQAAPIVLLVFRAHTRNISRSPPIAISLSFSFERERKIGVQLEAKRNRDELSVRMGISSFNELRLVILQWTVTSSGDCSPKNFLCLLQLRKCRFSRVNAFWYKLNSRSSSVVCIVDRKYDGWFVEFFSPFWTLNKFEWYSFRMPSHGILSFAGFYITNECRRKKNGLIH